MQQKSQKMAAEILYPDMDKNAKEVKPQRPPDMDPHEFALRQLYPSSYGEEWMKVYYERWKDDWD
ncbi:MAG: hypothetical protein LBM00_01320 [Deltaproteobacteria bacterium]|jgi:hypothetical protein|nr:hypothetical protein [Deltaproteobacteria bacterium]